ncbi:hypothetical protein K490DRAFT_62690 [Saccharata proteae CBS 121410]|uniref:Uncharacterized protein n=1 Tax=Saccharata proteae CBS 121410 TaxID=1314787 RepID=A0A9P4M1C4_9PEZI|nr:hypothetical protein K490DRAFT_62690 [Saccharata proteae CBS 121410]
MLLLPLTALLTLYALHRLNPLAILKQQHAISHCTLLYLSQQSAFMNNAGPEPNDKLHCSIPFQTYKESLVRTWVGASKAKEEEVGRVVREKGASVGDGLFGREPLGKVLGCREPVMEEVGRLVGLVWEGVEMGVLVTRVVGEGVLAGMKGWWEGDVEGEGHGDEEENVNGDEDEGLEELRRGSQDAVPGDEGVESEGGGNERNVFEEAKRREIIESWRAGWRARVAETKRGC